jgi:hypothetical protein
MKWLFWIIILLVTLIGLYFALNMANGLGHTLKTERNNLQSIIERLE